MAFHELTWKAIDYNAEEGTKTNNIDKIWLCPFLTTFLTTSALNRNINPIHFLLFSFCQTMPIQ